MKIIDTLKYVGIILGTLVLAASIFVFGFELIRADGNIQYCYIDSFSSQEVPKTFYRLYGYRPWRVDNKIGIFESFDLALQAAEQMKCPMRK